MLGRSTEGPAWAGEIPLLLMTIAYLGVILFLTSRRSRVTRRTLAISAGTGLLFGVVMYAVAPLGLSNHATDPWLPGSAADPLVALAWILLIGGPAAAAVLAAWRGRGPGGAALPRNVRFGQGIAAGVLANGTAALFVSALGFGTTALMLRSAWLLRWLNHGQHLTAIAAYRYEIGAGVDTTVYLFMLIWFPVIGLIMSALGAACAPPGRPAPGELTPVPGHARLPGCRPSPAPVRAAWLRRAGGVEQAEGVRPGGGLAAAGDTQLAEDVGHVHAGRLGRDEQLGGDLPVAAPGRDQAEYLEFAFGQA